MKPSDSSGSSDWSAGITFQFRTSYPTEWGQSLIVRGSGPLMGEMGTSRGKRMECRHTGNILLWETSFRMSHTAPLTYQYAVVNEEDEVVKWSAEPVTIRLPDEVPEDAVIQITDVWEDCSHPRALLKCDAFRSVVIGAHQAEEEGPCLHLAEGACDPDHPHVIFQIKDWQLRPEQRLCILGGAPGLGNWQLDNAADLRRVDECAWEIGVSIPRACLPLTYKYAIREADGSLTLEAGENHVMAERPGPKNPCLIYRHDSYFQHARDWRGAGLAVPVFSLRSKCSVGCGDFMDLRLLADLAAKTGMCLIQLLPVNDTCVRGDWRDSYPYSSLCVFALHPIYLCLPALPGASAAEAAAGIARARQELDGPDVDYEATLEFKLGIARSLFDAQREQIEEDLDFAKFVSANAEWLRPYAVFRYLQAFFGTSDHRQWGVYSEYRPEAVAKFFEPGTEAGREVLFGCYLQYHLHLQLAAASCYAADVGVALKGDLPIGVDPCSVDTWLYPHLFHLGTGTGSPPDWFNRNGQNWGFPTYNWEEMAAEGYTWWRRRLAHLSLYFQAFRVDHILGFFRIWEIPGMYQSGVMGHFRPSIPFTKAELEQKGIWDFDRLCDPYVTLDLLSAELGESLAEEVAETFFQPSYEPRLAYLPPYSQESSLRSLPPLDSLSTEARERWDDIKRTLVSLRLNVILIRDTENSDQFYPRFELAKLSSFQELAEPGWQKELADLHDDYFYHRHEELWRQQGLVTLPALQHSTGMLMCGEDLGFLPGCVHPVMSELGIVGLRIQRMPSAPGEFGLPEDYPYMCVASPSSHDTTTTREWYEADPDRRQRYYTQVLGGTGPAPPACTPEVMRAIAQQHMDSRAALAVFPIQDLMALESWPNPRPAVEETINDPSNPQHYWRYRMHLSLEELDCVKVRTTLQSLLLSSGRCRVEDLPALLVHGP